MGDSFGELIWDMGTKTALVLLLMYGVLLALKRYAGQQQPRRAGARIELLSTAALGPGRSVHLLSAGGKVLLVGATGQQVSLLAELDADAVEIVTSGEPVPTPAEQLQSRAASYVDQLLDSWRTRTGRDRGGDRR